MAKAEAGSEDFWRHPVVACNPRFLPAPLEYLDTDRYNPPGASTTGSLKFTAPVPGRFSHGP
jgi:hypothetical protein